MVTAPDDYTLAVAVAAGDGDAFTSLYERYFDRLYDFTARVVGDRDSAADAVQSTFVKAWRQLQERGAPEYVKPWLFAVARNEAIDELRRRKRFERPRRTAEDGEGDDDFARLEADRLDTPEAALADQEVASLVWRAAQGLNPSDYALLDMHVRQELSSEEMATALGVKPGALYTKLSRLRDSLGEAVTAEVLSRAARNTCSVLEAIVAGHEQLDRKLRKAISRHIEGCGACDASRRRLVSAAALFGALAPALPATGLKEQVLGRIRSATSGGPAGPPAAAGIAAKLLSLPALVAGGIAAVVVAAVAVAAVLAGGGADDQATIDPSPTPDGTATQPPSVPAVVLGTDVDSGFVVLNGAYLEPPYRFEIQGTDLRLNGTVVLSVSPVVQDSAEPAPSEPATAQDVVDAAASWLIAANLTDADIDGPRRHELLDQMRGYAVTDTVIDGGSTVLVRDRDGGEATMLLGTQPLPSSGDQLAALETQGKFWQDTLEQGGLLVLADGVTLEVPETRAAAFFAALEAVAAGGTREQLEYLAGAPELADAFEALDGIPEAIRRRLPDVLPAPLPTRPSETEPARTSAAISGRGGLFLSFSPIGHRLSITPGSMKAHFFFTVELSDASAGPVFAAARRHHYEIITYRRRDDPGRRNEAVTVEQFVGMLRSGDAGIIYISAHGVPVADGIPGRGGISIEGYPDADAAEKRATEIRNSPGYHVRTETAPRYRDDGTFIRTDHLVVFMSESHPDGYVGIDALFRDSLTIVEVDTCYGMLMQTGFRGAAAFIAPVEDQETTWPLSRDFNTTLWGLMDGTISNGLDRNIGDAFPLAQPKGGGIFRSVLGHDGAIVLSPGVVSRAPEGEVVIGQPVDGSVTFDTMIDPGHGLATVDPDWDPIAIGLGGACQPTLVPGSVRWANDLRTLHFQFVPKVPGTASLTVDWRGVRSGQNGIELDGNQNPVGTDHVGENWDDYVWEVTCRLGTTGEPTPPPTAPGDVTPATSSPSPSPSPSPAEPTTTTPVPPTATPETLTPTIVSQPPTPVPPTPTVASVGTPVGGMISGIYSGSIADLDNPHACCINSGGETQRQNVKITRLFGTTTGNYYLVIENLLPSEAPALVLENTTGFQPYNAQFTASGTATFLSTFANVPASFTGTITEAGLHGILSIGPQNLPPVNPARAATFQVDLERVGPLP